MDGTPQQLRTYIPLWEANKASLETPGTGLGRLDALWRAVDATTLIHRRIAGRFGQAKDAVSSLGPKALSGWEAAHPALLAKVQQHFPSFAPKALAPAEPDPIETILGDFEALQGDRKDKVAKNLALLWDNFGDMFGGISEFLAAPKTEQDAFMEKLKIASTRMEPARGTEAAFHYITVELMRQYISFFQAARQDTSAVALATCVVSLIDRGRTMADEPILYTLKS